MRRLAGSMTSGGRVSSSSRPCRPSCATLYGVDVIVSNIGRIWMVRRIYNIPALEHVPGSPSYVLARHGEIRCGRAHSLIGKIQSHIQYMINTRERLGQVESAPRVRKPDSVKCITR